MAVKKGNKIVTFTLTKYHIAKLAIICKRTSLSRTGVLQRWIEGYELFETEKKRLEGITPPSPKVKK